LAINYAYLNSTNWFGYKSNIEWIKFICHSIPNLPGSFRLRTLEISRLFFMSVLFFKRKEYKIKLDGLIKIFCDSI